MPTETSPIAPWAQTLVDPETGCWIWQGYCDEKGYGRIQVAGSSERVHRLMYRLIVGPIPAAYTLDHLCLRTSCCNPGHLEPVTRSENTRRMMFDRNGNSQKTRCPKDHPYDEENTYLIRGGKGGRGCRTCRREATRAWREKRAVASKRLDR